MISLEKIQKNKQIQEQKKKNKYKFNKINNSLPLLNKTIMIENKKLLFWISKIKKLNQNQTKELLDNYIKLNYYCLTLK